MDFDNRFVVPHGFLGDLEVRRGAEGIPATRGGRQAERLVLNYGSTAPGVGVASWYVLAVDVFPAPPLDGPRVA